MTFDINKEKEVIISTTVDKEVYSTKIIDELPEDINEYIYKYINGELIRIAPVPVKTLNDLKAEKAQELDTFILDLKNTGVEYQEKWFKCDDEAKDNLTQSMLFIDALLPLTWFSRNGEFGTITFTTKDEFLAFVQVVAGKAAEIQNKCYQYKFAIEQATTEEELSLIKFE